ncbi:MAG: DUF3426 domain-containing protein [Deltaproteobacteria bacterium]|nr:DUF3426 domain-containing protein [Deltaproteobacteria bacterium]
MIIRCEDCGTRYNLLEEKVKPAGTKVRCARCGSVFMVFPFSSEELPELEIFSEEHEKEEKPVDSAAALAGDSEESGQELSVSDSPWNSSGEESSPFDPADFVFGDENGSASTLSPKESDETGNPDRDFAFTDSFEGPSRGSAPREEEALAAEDVGEDFSPPPPLPSMEKGQGPVDLVHSEPPQKQSSLAGRLLLVLILVAAAIGGGLAGYLYWSGESLEAGRLLGKADSPSATAEGRIRLTQIEGFFVVNRDAGQLFVIRGQALNQFSQPRGTISVKGILYDTTGKPIAQKIAYCGNPLDDEALRTLSLRRIEEAMNNQFGGDFSNLTTAPGKSIPFIIVFQNVPDRLAEFSVDVNESNPIPADR